MLLHSILLPTLYTYLIKNYHNSHYIRNISEYELVQPPQDRDDST